MSITPPRPPLTLVVATEVLLGSLFLVGLSTIAFLPGFSTSVAMGVPEYSDLREPLLAIVIAFTTLGLIALAIVALLVYSIYSGAMLVRRSVFLVDILITTIGLAVALVITGFVVISNGQAGSPFIALIQLLACLTLIAIACITPVLRSLLQSAITMRTELEEVV